MKLIIAISFLLVLFLQNFNQLIVLAGYHLNREYIIDNVCENRDKPLMHCKGKCFLSKKFKEEEKQSEVPSSPSKKEIQIQLFIATKGLDLGTSPGNPSDCSFYSYNELETLSHSGSIFHPPGI